MEWSIQQLATAAGTTSRTLRHYGDVGLLEPSRVGRSGYRFYDERAVVRLQRILLLRQLGLGLPAIGEVLAGERDTVAALTTHLDLLEEQRERISRQIKSVRTTLRKLEGGEQLMAEEAFAGFDHTRHEEEVTRRWGRDAYERGDNWWRSLSEQERKAFLGEGDSIAAGFGAAARAGEPADGEVAQALAGRQHRWLSQTVEVSKEYFIGLGELYVSDPRFTEVYDKHEKGAAEFVRDAMKVYAEKHL